MFSGLRDAAQRCPQHRMMLGRELGLPAMASLRSVHLIEGKHSLSAELMVALVLKSRAGRAFHSLIESQPTKLCTYETKRKDANPKPQRLSYTNRAGGDRRGLTRTAKAPERSPAPGTRMPRIKCSEPAPRASLRASSTPTYSRGSTRRKSCGTRVDMTVQKLPSGFWHVRFGPQRFVQWAVGSYADGVG